MSQLLLDFVSASKDVFPDQHFGPGYRCSLVLNDETLLPCAIIRRRQPVVSLAIRRFKEEKRRRGIFATSEDPYHQIVSSFVTSGNCVDASDVKSVDFSPYAIPLTLLEEIEGETLMSWTGWVFEMFDGRYFSFGTTFEFAFFQLPDGYSFEDVHRVHNHAYVDEKGEIQPIHKDRESWFNWSKSAGRTSVYRERPYFVCYID